jgi:ABC-type nickel/cobalt efflux system permease component RcnA
MRRLIADMNPTLRGLIIVALIAAVIVVLSLEQTLAALYLLAGVAFFLAIAFFVYLLWRERRQEIELWPRRAKAAFYGAAALIAADVLVWSLWGAYGLEAAAFLLVLILCGWSMFRVWRDQRTYGY